MDASGLSERWELDEGNSFLYGRAEEALDGREPFHWEVDVLLENKEDPSEGLEIYGNESGSCGVDSEGNYEPYSLEFDEMEFGIYDRSGQELTDLEEGSDEAVFMDAFSEWLDFWHEDWYGERI